MKPANVRKFRSVAAFLRSQESQRKRSRRFRLGIALLGALFTVFAALTASGIIPPEGRDLAISAGAVAFGLSVTRS
jgi:hypothetical protein